MPESNYTCPLCGYEAPLAQFTGADDGMIRCRRCRSLSRDPNAYSPDCAYADCDSTAPVSRFPFALGGKRAVIRVREGYLALMVREDGSASWITEAETRLDGSSGAFRLYYVCLSPRLNWGTRGVKEFGAYGTARLRLSREYVMENCPAEGSLLTLEENLEETLIRFLTAFVESELRQGHTAQLEHPDGYTGALGRLRDGITLRSVTPLGFRSASGHPFTIPGSAEPEERAEAEAPAAPVRAPLAQVRIPQVSYTVKNRTEEVFFRGDGRTERHKAGEAISPDALRNVERMVRFQAKEFDLPCGWGVFNQPCGDGRYFAANGTVSFVVDSTEKLASLFIRTRDWADFEEQFFSDILRRELSAALRTLLGSRAGGVPSGSEALRGSLSSLSVELVNRLNGESVPASEPAFRRFGLRVRQIDILDLNLYSDRR